MANQYTDKWTEQDIETLRTMFPNHTSKEIGFALNRTPQAVKVYASKIGLLKSWDFLSNFHSKHTINHSYFNEMNTAEKWYWAGWLWADGCVYKDRRVNSFIMNLNLNEKDLYIIEKFKCSIEASQPITPSTQNCYHIQITSKQIYDDLGKIGIVENKSHDAKEPIGIPDKLLSHFIRGVFDGDGCIHLTKKWNHPMITIVGTRIFCEWLQKIIFEKLGIMGSVRDIHSKSGMTWVYGLYARDKARLFAEWMYQDCGDFKLDRKYNKFVNCGALNG